MSVGLVVVLVAAGVASGALAGLLGVGGGVFMVPLLVLVAGLDQHEAAATSLCVIVPTALGASRVLAKRGIGDITRALALGTVGAIGAVAGVLLALALPEDTLRIVFAAFLAAVGVRLLRDSPLLGPRLGYLWLGRGSCFTSMDVRGIAARRCRLTCRFVRLFEDHLRRSIVAARELGLDACEEFGRFKPQLTET